MYPEPMNIAKTNVLFMEQNAPKKDVPVIKPSSRILFLIYNNVCKINIVNLSTANFVNIDEYLTPIFLGGVRYFILLDDLIGGYCSTQPKSTSILSNCWKNKIIVFQSQILKSHVLHDF